MTTSTTCICRFAAALAVVALMTACAQDPRPEPRTATADPAFCAQIQTTGGKLSEYLALVAPEMQERTGVYALEEGDVSMVACAWLTQTAERTIDVQYFIWNKDMAGKVLL